MRECRAYSARLSCGVLNIAARACVCCHHRAYVHHDHDHLGIFCCVASFSMCTDALALASDIEGGVLLPLLTWPLLLSKLGAVSLLVYYRDAFA